MLSFTSEQLTAWLVLFIWPLVRVLALVASSPILGNPVIPRSAKIALSIALTLVIAPTLDPLPQIDPGSLAGLLILAQQIIIGVAMGLAMRVVFVAVDMAGNMIGLQMGLGFATLFDPINSAQVPVLSQFLGLLFTLVFLSLNGHLLMIEVLADSFRLFPISAEPSSAQAWRLLANWGSEIFYYGLLMALPMIAALLIANLSIGIMTRAAPQLNIFAVGFPITLAAGFMVLFVTVPFMLPLFERLMMDGVQTMLAVVQAAKP
ncbi:MAG: flagellar biosynthetic protein FliR [Sulfuricellaceae bacterium]|nr:flagellar biosynthetic protein FliR [Sulfuricellaceae bacterium]